MAVSEKEGGFIYEKMQAMWKVASVGRSVRMRILTNTKSHGNMILLRLIEVNKRYFNFWLTRLKGDCDKLFKFIRLEEVKMEKGRGLSFPALVYFNAHFLQCF